MVNYIGIDKQTVFETPFPRSVAYCTHVPIPIVKLIGIDLQFAYLLDTTIGIDMQNPHLLRHQKAYLIGFCPGCVQNVKTHENRTSNRFDRHGIRII